MFIFSIYTVILNLKKTQSPTFRIIDVCIGSILLKTAWSVSFLPQIKYNYRKKTCLGDSIESTIWHNIFPVPKLQNQIYILLYNALQIQI